MPSEWRSPLAPPFHVVYRAVERRNSRVHTSKLPSVRIQGVPKLDSLSVSHYHSQFRLHFLYPRFLPPLHTVLHVSGIRWLDCCLETVWILKFLLRPAISTQLFVVIFKKKRFNIPQVPCYSDSSVGLATKLRGGRYGFESRWGRKDFLLSKTSRTYPQPTRLHIR